MFFESLFFFVEKLCRCLLFYLLKNVEKAADMLGSWLSECVCMSQKFLFDFLGFFVKLVGSFLFVEKDFKKGRTGLVDVCRE